MPGNELAELSTPDNGRRLSEADVWDETTRPRGPAVDPARTYSVGQRATGAHLVEVRDHLRRELRQLRDVLDHPRSAQVRTPRP